jgi:preprotein translocase subunit SecE
MSADRRTEWKGVCEDVADKAPKRSFWKNVKTEFSKITWPDRETMVKQTTMVIFVSFVLGVIIAILDLFLQLGVDYITNIRL